MSEFPVPGIGAVFSADIAVPEHDREQRFYSRVLSTGVNPLWREKDLMNNRGMPIIGLGARKPEHADLPLQWMPHIQVADVVASAQRAVELGGRVLMQPKGKDGKSQWAVLLDPNAAAFGIVPVVLPEAVPARGVATADGAPMSMGRIYWLDLTVPDATATQAFYQQVIGWPVQSVEMKDGDERYADYNLLREDGTPAAGVCHARGVNADLPPVWMIYLPVGDLDESVRRVTEEGGKIIKAIKGGDGEYVLATIQDPVGVYLALMSG